ncbi:MAG: ribonuclease P protein component [Magnetococcales bacterium]|nr:ribonuclease P protein component [Magnetococcales bacterium]
MQSEDPSGACFPKHLRILDSREFRQIQNGGLSSKTPLFVLVWRPGSQAGMRLGLTVSRKVGVAVVRNRVKRVVREFFRQRIAGNRQVSESFRQQERSAQRHKVSTGGNPEAIRHQNGASGRSSDSGPRVQAVEDRGQDFVVIARHRAGKSDNAALRKDLERLFFKPSNQHSQRSKPRPAQRRRHQPKQG